MPYRRSLFSSVQFSRSVMSDSLWPHESQHARPPYSSSPWCHPTISSSVVPFSSCPQSFPASWSFPMSQLLIRWPKYWNFSFSISPSNEHPGLISFRMDWLDLFAVQGTLKSLLQHHSSKASIFWHSAFFTVQLSHPYMTTGKTIALTRLDLCWQLGIYFKSSSVYLSIPNFLTNPPPHATSTPSYHKFVLYVCESISVL